MVPIPLKIGRNEIGSCHRRLVKNDADATCCMELGDSILRHKLLNLYDSREPARWEMGPNQISSCHQRLARTDANRICRTLVVCFPASWSVSRQTGVLPGQMYNPMAPKVVSASEIQLASENPTAKTPAQTVLL